MKHNIVYYRNFEVLSNGYAKSNVLIGPDRELLPGRYDFTIINMVQWFRVVVARAGSFDTEILDDFDDVDEAITYIKYLINERIDESQKHLTEKWRKTE